MLGRVILVTYQAFGGLCITAWEVMLPPSFEIYEDRANEGTRLPSAASPIATPPTMKALYFRDTGSLANSPLGLHVR